MAQVARWAARLVFILDTASDTREVPAGEVVNDEPLLNRCTLLLLDDVPVRPKHKKPQATGSASTFPISLTFRLHSHAFELRAPVVQLDGHLQRRGVRVAHVRLLTAPAL